MLGSLGTTGDRTALEDRPVYKALPANEFVLTAADQSVIGEPQIVFAREENTLSDLAREYGLGYDEIVAANPGVDPWLPGNNTPILLPTQYILPSRHRDGVVLNIATRRLFYFPQAIAGQQRRVLTYPIGIGRVGWETPVGDTTVVSKARDPHWWVPSSVRREHAEMGDPLPAVVPPGPDNPLGHRVLKLGMPGYLIHGTNKPYGVGMRVSHGCVRLYPENIEFLYELVDIGEPVTIINEPYQMGRRNGVLFFEAHEPLEEDETPVDVRLQALFDSQREAAGKPLNVRLQQHVRTLAEAPLGVPLRVAMHDADEYLARVRVVRNTVEDDPDAPTLTEVRALSGAAAD
ncbi:MAG: L,D-transpeptidase family protein [Gammaproteobacteria bacterium]|nr:L,D-transpeptidase family protein [Gammaproteobacteria bacterium]